MGNKESDESKLTATAIERWGEKNPQHLILAICALMTMLVFYTWLQPVLLTLKVSILFAAILVVTIIRFVTAKN